MIKLERAAKPAYLAGDNSVRLTEAFKESGGSVWNHGDIKKALLESSYEKCAYCECSIVDESKYMEVEHFRCKSAYEELVVEWCNLLPSCKRCNVAKGDHDVANEPIVNPYDVDPREHISFRLFRLKGLTDLGSATIAVADLNNLERLVFRRFEVAQQVSRSVEVAMDRLAGFLESKTTLRKNKLVGMVETILQECQPAAVYSAVTATVVLTDENFLSVVQRMKVERVWLQHLEELYEKASSLVLRVV